jgi:hypothetical protein
MAERDRLLSEHRSDVVALDPAALPVAQELFETALDHLIAKGSHRRDGNHILRPDGVRVPLTPDDPLGCLGRLHQEDFCLLEKRGTEHVLTGAILCFPASWRLSEKFLHPLVQIHAPVSDYDANIARRVQRLFDGVLVGRPLWRFNVLWYDDPTLFQPRSEIEPRPLTNGPDRAPYFRSERQCLWRLPKTEAVVFSIHTFVIARQNLPAPWSKKGAG